MSERERVREQECERKSVRPRDFYSTILYRTIIKTSRGGKEELLNGLTGEQLIVSIERGRKESIVSM